MAEAKKWREAVGLDLLDYPIPAHANGFWYSLGGLSLLCFLVTMASGILLSQFYNPNPAMAHASVRYISAQSGLGFLRALHAWSAQIGFVLLLAHMLRVMISGAYRRPRTVTYLIGLALLFVAFQGFFTGTVLKWDQEGYEAMAHFVAVNKLFGPLGAVFQEDFTLSTSMLARIYALHIGLIPLLFLSLVGLHALYVKHFGIAPQPYQSTEEYNTSLHRGATFKNHLIRLAAYGLPTLLVLGGFALLFPPGLLEAPQSGIEITKPPWLFWVFYPLENLMGIRGILAGSLVLFCGLIAIPVLEMLIRDERKLFRLVNVIVIAGVLLWLAMLIITFFSPVMQHM